MNNNLKQTRPLIIFGAGGHAVSVFNVATSAGFTVFSFIDKNKVGERLLGIPIIASINALPTLGDYVFAIAVGDNAVRARIFSELSTQFAGLQFPVLVHQSAILSVNISLGEGTVVMPQAIVGPNSNVGRFCILNSQCSLDHDCTLADFSSLGPGVITGGGVNIGLRSAVSLGAMVNHRVKIGADTVIGANSYVNKDVESNVIAYGTPVKVVRARKMGEAYLN